MIGGGERRNFDATRLPPIRKSRNLIRMMLPMTLCCNTCRKQMSKGTKFTSRIEKLLETSPSSSTTHLDRIPSFRFYFRCIHCCAHLAMTTDPINFDYILESGATRVDKRDFDFGEEEDHPEVTKRRKLDEEFGSTPQLEQGYDKRRLEQAS